jgi:hypothetical protein
MTVGYAWPTDYLMTVYHLLHLFISEDTSYHSGDYAGLGFRSSILKVLASALGRCPISSFLIILLDAVKWGDFVPRHFYLSVTSFSQLYC